MKRFYKWDKTYLYWGITALCVVAAAVVFRDLISFLPAIGGFFGKVFTILSPFIWGLVITYLLKPIFTFSEKKLFIPLANKITAKSRKGKDGRKFARIMAVLFSMIFFLALLTALINLIIPQLYTSIEQIVKMSPVYIETISGYLDKILVSHPEIEDYLSKALGDLNTSVFDFLKTQVLPSLGNVVTGVTTGVIFVFKGVYNLIIGIIVSIYLLLNIESFVAGSRKLLYSIFTIDAAEWIRRGLGFADKTFMGFINGKILDSLIIGIICYLFCAIVNMPYALLVSVIIGVTNIIPFFGPLIGAVPCALIILLENPLKCLIFVVFIIILQQIDGNIIGPKILGSSIGINGFWVMFSIILGGGLFGFWGMLLGVPVFVVFYTGVSALITRKLKRSDLPADTAAYLNLDHIDSATREVNYKS